jgi:hypothetical protein
MFHMSKMTLAIGAVSILLVAGVVGPKVVGYFEEPATLWGQVTITSRDSYTPVKDREVMVVAEDGAFAPAWRAVHAEWTAGRTQGAAVGPLQRDTNKRVVDLLGRYWSTTVKTDNVGIYRVSGLKPGQYVVVTFGQSDTERFIRRWVVPITLVPGVNRLDLTEANERKGAMIAAIYARKSTDQAGGAESTGGGSDPWMMRPR